jgi:hypothetical protein
VELVAAVLGEPPRQRVLSPSGPDDQHAHGSSLEPPPGRVGSCTR